MAGTEDDLVGRMKKGEVSAVIVVPKGYAETVGAKAAPATKKAAAKPAAEKAPAKRAARKKA